MTPGDQKNGRKIFSSSLGMKYPNLRDHPLKTGLKWLEGKRADDNTDGLWRVHDSLYDLREFVKNHPGGADWLRMTKGTDITEAFEAHHISQVAENLLPKFFVKKADHLRNAPFTFKENGFYRTLKRAVAKEIPRLPKGSADRSKCIADILFTAYVTLAVLAAHYHSFSMGLMSGLFLGLNSVAAHNFFHQRDNFRMHYFDFTFLQSRNSRITHALSHHLYTNTINDYEISMAEPWFQYLPGQKNIFWRYVSWLYTPLVYGFHFFMNFIQSVIEFIVVKDGYNLILPLPFSVLVLMVVASGNLLQSAAIFLWIQMTASFYFTAVGLNAGHHHPDVFHDGDAARPKDQLDWGIHQLDTTMDRKDITGSHFLVLTNFGDHALHHLFPTLDHGLLEHLYPTFLKVCDDFGVTWKLSTEIESIKGQFRQLAKVEPNQKPPSPPKVKQL